MKKIGVEVGGPVARNPRQVCRHTRATDVRRWLDGTPQSGICAGCGRPVVWGYNLFTNRNGWEIRR